jgi:DNA-directed RNA polymerase specialized sigma24 family protein
MAGPAELADTSAPSAPDFETIYEEMADFVWRAVGRMGVTPADAEDVVQEVRC